MKTTAFIHGRPGPHERNAQLAKSIGADFFFFDRFLRYHDRQKGKLFTYLSWMVNALVFPRKKYDVILTLGVLFPPVFMRMIGLWPKSKKMVGLIVGEELFFLHTKYYKGYTYKLMYHSIKSYDALICKGDMQIELANLVYGNKSPKLYKIQNGLSQEKRVFLNAVTPSFDKNLILCVANGPDGFRTWYKGMDIMMKSFVHAKKFFADLQIVIIGDWNAHAIENILALVPVELRKDVLFEGNKKWEEIVEYFKKSSLFYLMSRGDCFPNVVLEAMGAGLPCMISNWTGVKEIVQKVSSEFIVAIEDEEKVRSKLVWYLNLTKGEKVDYSKKCKDVISEYTIEKNIDTFKKAFYDCIES